MITLKTEEDLAFMRKAGHVVADVLRFLREQVRPGITTKQLADGADELICRSGARSAFKGYSVPGIPIPFPGIICTSVNEEIVHGIPGARVLQEGDIVSVDVGVVLDGYYGDAACTYPVGRISTARRELLAVTLASLHRALDVVRSGRTVGDIGNAIEATVRSRGFGLVRSYAGHGVGRKLHEPPQVPNFGKPRSGVTLKEGMTLAIEPMVMAGGEEIICGRDKWTVLTADRSDAAHFEHSVVVRQDGAEILTPWEE